MELGWEPGVAVAWLTWFGESKGIGDSRSIGGGVCNKL